MFVTRMGGGASAALEHGGWIVVGRLSGLSLVAIGLSGTIEVRKTL
jgi:hypothetical protein